MGRRPPVGTSGPSTSGTPARGQASIKSRFVPAGGAHALSSAPAGGSMSRHTCIKWSATTRARPEPTTARPPPSPRRAVERQGNNPGDFHRNQGYPPLPRAPSRTTTATAVLRTLPSSLRCYYGLVRPSAPRPVLSPSPFGLGVLPFPQPGRQRHDWFPSSVQKPALRSCPLYTGHRLARNETTCQTDPRRILRPWF